jgi:hypothetical protein
MSKKENPQTDPLYAAMWRLAYAGRSFQHVMSICDYVTQTPIPDSSPVFYPAMTAAYALYARPFKKNRVIGKLSIKIVPEQFVRLHEQIIAMRDQLLVHSDADPSVSLDGLPGNSVRLYRSGHRLDVGAYEMKPRETHVPEIHDLAAALHERTLGGLKHLMATHASKLPATDGMFEVDLKLQQFVPVVGPAPLST